MRILDPSKTFHAVQHPDPPGVLQPRARKFGFVPSLDKLRPGDLLLVSQIKAPFVSRTIRAVQAKAGFDDLDGEWHHAAVWVGNDLLCEAQGSGVRTRAIYDYCAGTHKLRFRRPPDLSDLDSALLALEAALKIRYGYNRRAIFELWLQANTGWGRVNGDRPKPLSPRATICSQLYADAYGLITRRTLDAQAVLGVTPAHLSASKLLVDIEMQWYAIDPAQTAAGTPTQDADMAQ